MEDIQVILQLVTGLSPAEAGELLAKGLGLALALRTLLRALVAFFSWLDARDGELNWGWYGKVADALDWVDARLARLPVKAPGLLEKRVHAAPSKAQPFPESRP